MKLQKVIFTYLILFATLQILVACTGNTEKALSDEKPILSDNQRNEVSLQVIDISNGKASLELSNKTNEPIYLAYSPSDINNAKTGHVYYNLDCKRKGEKEYKDYGINVDAVPSIDPLDNGKSIHFEVSRLPITEAICRISIMYYDNENIADLINNKNPELNKSEIELVERSQKFIELTFDVITK